MLRMGPKSAGRSASGPKSSILVTSLPPPLVVASARCLPVRAASSAAATDSDGWPCLLHRRRICSCRRVEQRQSPPPLTFTGCRLPTDGGFSPHPAGPHRTARPPRRDEHGEGRKETRVAWRWGFSILFLLLLLLFTAGVQPQPRGAPHPPHVVPRAQQQQQPAAGMPVKGTVYPRA